LIKLEIDDEQTEKVILKRNLLREDIKEKQECDQLFTTPIFKELRVEIMWNLNHFESVGDAFLKEIAMFFEHSPVGFSFMKVGIGFGCEIEEMK
jgi:hypothetical protein